MYNTCQTYKKAQIITLHRVYKVLLTEKPAVAQEVERMV